MATCVPADIPNMKLPSQTEMPPYSNQNILGLITGVQTSTGKYDGREDWGTFVHRPDKGGLGYHTDMVLSHQYTPTASHKGGARKTTAER